MHEKWGTIFDRVAKENTDSTSDGSPSTKFLEQRGCIA